MNGPATTASCRVGIALAEKPGDVPSEILVFPVGRIEGRDGRWWINDQPHLIVLDFEMQGVDLPIDYEHGSELAEPNGQPMPAAGWIKGLEVRDGELWARVQWTERARQMIEAGEYRYLSPTFFFDPDSMAIVGLSSIALVNQPNFRHTALNRRGAGQTEPEQQETTMKPEARKALCRKLGLAEEASDDAIATAVEALQSDRDKALNSAKTPPLDQFVPRGDHDKVKGELEKANNRLAEIADKEITDLVDAAVQAGKVAPASKDYHLAACKTEGGLERFKAMVGDLATNAVTQPSDLNGKTPPNAGGTLTADEKAICKNLGLTREQFIKERDGQKAA